MKEIKCPNCGTVIPVDDAAFAALLSQVRTEEFDAELNRRVEEVKKLQTAEAAVKVAEVINRKETELRRKQEEINRLISDYAAERKIAAERVQALLETHRVEKESLEKEVELYKNFKARRSVKLLGEDLEQHCFMLYNQTLAPVMPSATFGKDNTAVRDEDETKGSKGDFIFRDREDGVEYVSIMFEMKNESDASANRHRNADFFDKLDRDRTKKGCEFAVLVSMLEMDNDMYNNGIVSVPGYEKMYVVRPDNFIPIITLLVQTSKKAVGLKKELEVAKTQNYDISRFEESVFAFRDAFTKNVTNAKKKYDEAIDGIDKAIKTMEAIKKALQVSAGHLDAANNKVEDLSIKKLTKGNPTMKAAFEEVRAKKAAEEGPDEQ